MTLSRLASSTGESAFYSIRLGDECVCLLREDGSFPIRSFVLFEGARFPIGVVSAGLVILAFLPDHDIDDLLSRKALSEEWGDDLGDQPVRRRIAETRRVGYDDHVKSV